MGAWGKAGGRPGEASGPLSVFTPQGLMFGFVC